MLILQEGIIVIILMILIMITIKMATLQECILRRPLHRDVPRLPAEARPLGRRSFPGKKIITRIFCLFIKIIIMVIIIGWEEMMKSISTKLNQIIDRVGVCVVG